MLTAIAVKTFKWTAFILKSVDEGSKKSNPSTFLLKKYHTETFVMLQRQSKGSMCDWKYRKNEYDCVE